MRPQQMMTWVLVGSCALLGLLAGAQMTGLGGGFSLHGEQVTAGGGVADADLATRQVELPPFQRYVEMQQRPLFNDDRRPAPVEAVEEPPGGPVTPTVSPVDVTLTGVIITENSRLAILQDNKAKSAVVLREGMPLKGDQAAWVLSKVEPRKVTFDGGGEPTEVALALNTKVMQAPAQPAPARPRRNAAANAAETEGQPEDPQAAAQTRAEEIRKKIEERRRQMREEAQRANATANARNKGA